MRTDMPGSETAYQDLLARIAENQVVIKSIKMDIERHLSKKSSSKKASVKTELPILGGKTAVPLQSSQARALNAPAQRPSSGSRHSPGALETYLPPWNPPPPLSRKDPALTKPEPESEPEQEPDQKPLPWHRRFPEAKMTQYVTPVTELSRECQLRHFNPKFTRVSPKGSNRFQWEVTIKDQVIRDTETHHDSYLAKMHVARKALHIVLSWPVDKRKEPGAGVLPSLNPSIRPYGGRGRTVTSPELLASLMRSDVRQASGEDHALETAGEDHALKTTEKVQPQSVAPEPAPNPSNPILEMVQKLDREGPGYHLPSFLNPEALDFETRTAMTTPDPTHATSCPPVTHYGVPPFIPYPYGLSAGAFSGDNSFSRSDVPYTGPIVPDDRSQPSPSVMGFPPPDVHSMAPPPPPVAVPHPLAYPGGANSIPAVHETGGAFAHANELSKAVIDLGTQPPQGSLLDAEKEKLEDVRILRQEIEQVIGEPIDLEITHAPNLVAIYLRGFLSGARRGMAVSERRTGGDGRVSRQG